LDPLIKSQARYGLLGRPSADIWRPPALVNSSMDPGGLLGYTCIAPVTDPRWGSGVTVSEAPYAAGDY
jgi:hypothetical protein